MQTTKIVLAHFQKTKNKKLNASDDDWSEVRNSPLMKDVPKMLNGEWHSRM